MVDFVINDRFSVNASASTIHDLSVSITTRIEPRILQILQILATNSGKLVTREELIEKVWNHYGGADDGLNQAVSFLRKVLADASKDLIRTIPKKGYILQANITEISAVTKQNRRRNIFNRSRNLYAVLISLSLLAVLVCAVRYLHHSGRTTDPLETAFPIDKQSDFTTPLNTITTTDSIGNHYKLILIGDRPPQFYKNDTLQLNQEAYTLLIDNLSKQLWERQKAANE